MVFPQKGPAVGGVMGIKPAQLGLLQVGDSDQAVEVFQQGGFVQGGESGEGGGVQGFFGDARLPEALPVVGGTVPGVPEEPPQPLLLYPLDLCRGKAFISLQSP